MTYTLIDVVVFWEGRRIEIENILLNAIPGTKQHLMTKMTLDYVNDTITYLNIYNQDRIEKAMQNHARKILEKRPPLSKEKEPSSKKRGFFDWLKS